MMRVCVYWDDDLWVGYDFVMLKSGTVRFIFLILNIMFKIYSNECKNEKKSLYMYIKNMINTIFEVYSNFYI